jgi:putative transcriptional regulator
MPNTLCAQCRHAGPQWFLEAQRVPYPRTSLQCTVNLTRMLSRLYCFPMRLTNAVREHRVLSRMTQEELANAVDVSRQTVIAMEKGSYTPSALLALRLARTFGVAFEDVFGTDEE